MSRRAFTLMEVLAALTVTILLAAGSLVVSRQVLAH